MRCVPKSLTGFVLAGFVLAALLVTGSAGAGELKFTSDGGSYEKRGTADQVQVLLLNEPGGKSYTKVGNMEWDYTSNAMEVQLIDLVPKLRQMAWDNGGDAIVVREFGYQGMPDPGKPFRVRADVIRWQP